MQTNDPPRRLGFGVFGVDLRDRQLTKRGLRIRLQDQPFQVLAMLLERPGEVVTRDELRNRLWPNTVVEFDHGLNKAISKIREVLGDSVESPRFVETVARRGYRFLADVAVIDIPDRQSEPTPVDRTDAGASSKQAVRPYIWSLVFGLALVLTVLKAFASRWPRLPA
jgi:DNA-binding winged helix-turn-helix (wHTH) protein